MQVDMFIDADDVGKCFKAEVVMDGRGLTLSNPERRVSVTFLPIAYDTWPLMVVRAKRAKECAAIKQIVQAIVYAYLDASGSNLGDLFPDEVEEVIEAAYDNLDLDFLPRGV